MDEAEEARRAAAILGRMRTVAKTTAPRPGRPQTPLDQIPCTCGAGDAAPLDRHAGRCRRRMAAYKRAQRARDLAEKPTAGFGADGADVSPGRAPESSAAASVDATVREAAATLGRRKTPRKAAAHRPGRPKLPLDDVPCTCGAGTGAPLAEHRGICRKRLIAANRRARARQRGEAEPEEARRTWEDARGRKPSQH